ncbi:MAG: carbamoyltransferase N-terminal domain-containing protein [Patescibacteria group bacterium]
MYILGISCFYHDASAALLKDGAIVAAAQEERFTRKKHDISFPINAINFCLKSQNITIKDIDHIGFYEKPFLKFERLLFQHLESFPRSMKTFLSSMPSWLNEKLRVPKIIRKKLGCRKGVLFVEHHLAHAASSFLVSPFRDAAILTEVLVAGVAEVCPQRMAADLSAAYLASVRFTIDQGSGVVVGDDVAVTTGLSACAVLDAGDPGDALVTIAAALFGVEANLEELLAGAIDGPQGITSGAILASAVTYLCPEHAERVEEFIDELGA